MAKVTVYNVGGSYFLRDPETGAVGTYDQEQVRDLLINGYQPARQVEYEKQEEEKQYDRPGEAALGGFVRGATFGLSDLARTAMPNADLMAADERKLKEYNPTASTVGEIGGTIAGMAVPTGRVAKLGGELGQASLGGRITKIGEKVTERLFNRAERGAVEPLIGPLVKEAPSALQKLAGRATAGVIEGSIYGAEQAMADVSLSPKEQRAADIAKTFLSHTAAGAALGGGMTSTFSLLGSLGKYTGQKLGVRGGKVLDEFRDAQEKVASLEAQAGERSKVLQGQVLPDRKALEQEAKNIHSKFDILSKEMGEDAAAKPGIAYSELVRDHAALQGKLDEVVGLRQAVDETKAAIKAAKEGVAQAPKETVTAHPKRATLDEYETLIQTMKKNKKGAVPELADLWQETLGRVALKKDYAKHLKGEINTYADLIKQANSLRAHVTLTDIPKGTPNHQRLVMVLDDLRGKMKMDRLGEQAKNKLLLEGKLLEGQKGLDLKPIFAEVRAGGVADATKVAAREDATNLVSHLEQKLAETDSALKAAQQQFDRWGSPTDVVVKGAGAKRLQQLKNSITKLQSVDDGLRGQLDDIEQKLRLDKTAKEELATLGKSPELIQAMEEAAVLGQQLQKGKAGLLPKILRRAVEWQTARTGMQAMGASARRLGGGTGVVRTAAALELGRWVAPRLMTALEVGGTPIIKAARYGVRGTVAGLARPVKVGTVKGVLEGEDEPLTEGEFKQVSNELLSTNPDLIRVTTSEALRDAPESLNAVANKDADRWQFLIGKLPQDPQQVRAVETGTVVIPVDKEWRPNRDAMLKFSRYLKTAADPRTFITDLAKQQVSPEAVETMQALYPEILDGLRQVVRQMVREAVLKKQVYPVGQARQLAMFLGQPVSSISPSSLTLRLQSNFGHNQERGMPTRGKGLNIRKTVFSEQNLTPLQMMEARK
jgi:hypothetical protein